MGLLSKLKNLKGKKNVNLEFNELKNSTISEYENIDSNGNFYKEEFEAINYAEDYNIKGIKRTQFVHNGRFVEYDEIVPINASKKVIGFDGYPRYLFLSKNNSSEYVFSVIKQEVGDGFLSKYVLESENENGYFCEDLPKFKLDMLFEADDQLFLQCSSDIYKLNAEISKHNTKNTNSEIEK